MKASVVMCAYTEDRWELLTQALDSLHRQTLVPAQIVVVIDHNEPLFRRVTEHVKHRVLGNTVVVQNRFDQGLSGARNTGMEWASAPLVAFIDDDAEADVDWLTYLVEPFDDQGVVAVGGAIDAVWPSRRPTWFPREFDWVVGCTYLGMPATQAEVRNPIGANMAFRREPLERIGGFDPTVGRVGARAQGCEETVAAIRVCALDPRYRVMFEPRALVNHHVAAGRASWRYFSRRCFSEGVSKAQVSRLAGSGVALETERAYVRTVLPRAVRSSLTSAVRKRKPSLASSAGAVLAGLTITCVGYLAGVSRPRAQKRAVQPTFQ